MSAHKPAGAVETIEAAPAKINLALHVTGQRADGYHLLEMLVTFTEAGDVIHIRDAQQDGFSISGPFAERLQNERQGGNLVLTARDLLRRAAEAKGHKTLPVAIHLEKNLPIASGIGGGSADAAATLRGLSRHWGVSLPAAEMEAIALQLGADVPMCLASSPLIACGIGETIVELSSMPQFSMVLVNPLKEVSTPRIFGLLNNKNNDPLPEIRDDTATNWRALLPMLRNDLQPPAMTLLPEITEILELLSAESAEVSRMSGSGATCFGLFASLADAQGVAARLRERHPHWYVEATKTTVTRSVP